MQSRQISTSKPTLTIIRAKVHLQISHLVAYIKRASLLDHRQVTLVSIIPKRIPRPKDTGNQVIPSVLIPAIKLSVTMNEYEILGTRGGRVHGTTLDIPWFILYEKNMDVW